ncbi:sigma-54-dependent transcriptional regulator [Phocaeicola plebeius]|jgi:two-component system NtrC family response regulator|uniref:sigma-54-dependent transcriptional regulator n=1 Tax=Phocaeicola plebeius TaxID=310297 RepID=UPI00241E7AC8|nr:sigma-54 dependent transcriptional regulator [Phocaeicola plebeius]MBS5540137.1 sigma-54-dependent Fis family transcriptional regulator [Phocaeicola plebeius]
MIQILVIDDEDPIRNLLARMIELEGYKVWKASDCQSALKLLKAQPFDVVLCDVFLPDGNGVDFIREIKKHRPEAEVILLTAHGNIPDGVQAIKNGAFDYITKGDDNRKIIPTISRAVDEVEKKKGKVAPLVSYSFESIIGSSNGLKQAVALARKVADTDVPVLLTGETGTGKEVFSHAIHYASPRSQYPIMAINCSAFSKDLLESELFGYKAGAFTGAMKDKPGLFEVANHGTVFLDEIGEMAFDLQARLLRVLETGEYIKVGDTKPTKVDVRIISATNRDLKKEIENGHFREDLYFRLSVFQIHLPPLRERKEDIEMLAETFLKRFAAKLKKEIKGMTSEVVDILKGAEWRGNIRELKNVMERSAIVCDEEVTVQDLPIDLQCAGMDEEQGKEEFELAVIEQKHITKVLQYTRGNKTEAARLLKIGLATLYRKIEAYHISI